MKALFFFVLTSWTYAFQLSDFTNKDVSLALKEALTKSVKTSVGQLGVADGFWGNSLVKVPLPESLKSIEKTGRRFGMGGYFDDLHLKLNRAAEGAVSQATPILLDSLKKMSLQDAKKIISGSDTAATEYFKNSSSDQLRQQFLPIVKKVTTQIKLVESYNQWAGKLNKFGLTNNSVDLESYVTEKALEGLFVVMSQKEQEIRKNPVEQGSAVIKKVFGSIVGK